MGKEMIAMLLAGGQGSRLYALTQKLAKPAVPFGGKYRIIDFPLSNCVNSGIDTVGILTQYQPLELNEYIGNGQPWDLDRIYGGVHVLPPYQKASGSDWYKGTANAIYQNISFIERYDPDDPQLFALYRQDAAAFERAFPDWPRWFENLLANHIFYEDFPFTDKRLTPLGEYTGLVGVYAAMRVMSVGCTAERAERDALIDALSGLFRCIEHAAFYLNADYLLECEEQGDRGLLGGVLAL